MTDAQDTVQPIEEKKIMVHLDFISPYKMKNQFILTIILSIRKCIMVMNDT